MFPIRRDRIGLRPVFMLGNLNGRCPFDCTFCGVKAEEVTAAGDAREHFREQWLQYRPLLDGPYHPIIYNEGNVTNHLEFPAELLAHILEFFRADERVQYIALNSREKYATEQLLSEFQRKHLPFPVHFVFGLESVSEKAHQMLGKNTRGELKRFARKLSRFNKRVPGGGTYSFGLDVNLLFLPQLYTGAGTMSTARRGLLAAGLERDIEYVLDVTCDGPPVQINIHPYYQVEALPFTDAEVGDLVRILPQVQAKIVQSNRNRSPPAHLFVGIEGKGYQTSYWQQQSEQWGAIIDIFNATGYVDPWH